MRYLETHWPQGLEIGIIHADLFPDNVFFLGDKLSGLIDFYFACTDFLAYDLAICINAWCFETDGSFNVTKARKMVRGLRFASQDPGGRDRGAADPGARLGAALPADAALRLAEPSAGRLRAAEGPAGISPQAALPPAVQVGLGLRHLMSAKAAGNKIVEIFTDGACSGNPGPGRLGRDPALRRCREGTERRRAADHQQPHGADGRDHGDRGGEAAVRDPPAHRQRISAPGHHHLDPQLEGARLEDRRQEAGEERRPVAAPGSARSRPTTCTGTGSRAIPATSRTSARMSWRGSRSGR